MPDRLPIMVGAPGTRVSKWADPKRCWRYVDEPARWQDIDAMCPNPVLDVELGLCGDHLREMREWT